MKTKKESIWDDIANEYFIRITNLSDGSYCDKYEGGCEFWYDKKGQPHRGGNEPALIYDNGYKEWHVSGTFVGANDYAVDSFGERHDISFFGKDGSKFWFDEDGIHWEHE